MDGSRNIYTWRKQSFNTESFWLVHLFHIMQWLWIRFTQHAWLYRYKYMFACMHTYVCIHFLCHTHIYYVYTAIMFSLYNHTCTNNIHCLLQFRYKFYANNRLFSGTDTSHQHIMETIQTKTFKTDGKK